MAHIPHDLIRSLLYSAVLVIFLRAARIYALVFLSASFGVLVRATIEIHSGGQTGPWKGKNPSRTERRRGNDERGVSPPERLSNSSSSKVVPNATSNTAHTTTPSLPFQDALPPPPYSTNPPKLGDESRSESILNLYEDIIASDAQTIQVQQSTMSAQQETIRAQAQMIRNMRTLLERQDERIEELEQVLEGGVSWQKDLHP